MRDEEAESTTENKSTISDCQRYVIFNGTSDNVDKYSFGLVHQIAQGRVQRLVDLHWPIGHSPVSLECIIKYTGGDFSPDEEPS